MKLSVVREALVIPWRSGSAWAGLPPSGQDFLVLLIGELPLHLIAHQVIAVSGILDLDLAEHLPDNDFDGLSLIFTPGGGRFPGLIDQVFGQLLIPLTLRMSSGLAGAPSISTPAGDVAPLPRSRACLGN